MGDLIAARLGMAASLGFHILFAAAGIAMPRFVAVSGWRLLRSRDPVCLYCPLGWR